MGHFEKILFFVAALGALANGQTEHKFNNGTYHLMTHGNATTKSIHFYIMVATTGWVAVGVGPNPNMTNADLVIGGINDANGSPYYTDMYATGNGKPLNDTKTVSDWEWVFGIQDSTGNVTTTYIEFSRLSKTNDYNTDQDYEIKNEDSYTLMAYVQSDTFEYHGNPSRISEAVNLCKEAVGICNPGNNTITTTASPTTTTTPSPTKTTTSTATTDGSSMTVLLSICIAAAVKIIL